MIAEVIINRTAKKLNRTFDYQIPKEMEEYIYVGTKVLVPFGRAKKLEEGFVVGFKENTEYEVKEIAKIEENLTEKQIELAKWMSKKYYCNVTDCIKLMQTPGTRTKENKIKDKTINSVYLKKEVEEIEYEIQSGMIKSEKHQRVLNFVKNNEGATIPEIESFTDCSRAIVNTLIKNGYLEIVEQTVKRDPLANKLIEHTEKLILNDEQLQAYNRVRQAIKENRFEKFLLFGVTGSGKTEIYLQLIDDIVKEDKAAIMLVPEISLTPQMIERFIARFGKEQIAVLHSKLSIGERHDEWERIRENKAKIIIGARSAIFAPIPNLGLIIIDEEHDSSYKSESSPRYDAKEVALQIAQDNKIPLLLGSATPDISTYYNATEKKNITLLELTKRANNAQLPKVEIVDLKQELATGNRSMLSRELYKDIEENLKNKQQTILFLNRRGFSTFIMCRECGYTVKCDNCNVSMTYHGYENKLKCHYCGAEKPVVTKCPECGSEKIRYFGTGTQKLEQEIIKQFPGSTTIRMDVDTVSKKNSHEQILNKFKNENIDILIGTQMVVKGHHFPNVTLVGVIAADSSLNIDDYRATERTFQILTQVAGRAGRGELPGKVIIQTYNPENFSIQAAQKQNYLEFYETELALRKQLKYPPFCDIIVMRFEGKNENLIKQLSLESYNFLCAKKFDCVQVFRPAPAPIDKIQNRFRWRIIMKGILDSKFNGACNELLSQIYMRDVKDVRVSFDVNPNNMV